MTQTTITVEEIPTPTPLALRFTIDLEADRVSDLTQRLREIIESLERGNTIGAGWNLEGEEYAFCDECGEPIPDVNGGSLTNRHHAKECSLYSASEE